MAQGEIPQYPVTFSDEALTFFETLEPAPDARSADDWKRLITQTLEWDPRPTSQRRAMPIESSESEGLAFGLRVQDVEIRWEIHQGGIRVIRLSRAVKAELR
jgi:hypothetical protein